MYKNKALIDRTLNIPPINDNNVMMYRKLTSLIMEYNIMARDKGLPVKSIPVYSNNMNCSLMIQSVTSTLKDIDKVKNIKENAEEVDKPPKTARDVEFTEEIITELPNLAAWKEDGSLWYYIQDGDDICVYADTSAVITKMNGGTTLELDRTDMPYEVLVDKNGNELRVNSYTVYEGIVIEEEAIYSGLFGYHPGNENWNNNVVFKLTSLTLHNWTNRNVTNMSFMFYGCSMLQSLTLGNNFDTSSVEDMSYMFGDCSSLTSLTLGTDFNTSSVTNMRGMFSACFSLTSLDLGTNFNTSSVEDMSYMFYGCSSLETLTLSKNFDTSSVEDMSYMFHGCSALQSLELGTNFNTSSVEDMNSMFGGCSALQSLELGTNFNTSSVTDMGYMFYSCSKLALLTLSNNFDTSKVTNMSYMFGDCSSLTSLTLGNNFDTSSVEDMSYMFGGCSALESLSLGDRFDTSKVEDMGRMFYSCSKLALLTLSNNFVVPSDYDTNTTRLNPDNPCTIYMNEIMYKAFKDNDLKYYTFSPESWNAEGATIQEITVTLPTYKIARDVVFNVNAFDDGIWTYTILNTDTVKVTLNVNIFSTQIDGNMVMLDYDDMPYEILITTGGAMYSTISYDNMFSDLPPTVTMLTLQNWINRRITDMSNMFYGCSSLETLTLGNNFDTSSVTDMSSMFYGCSALTTLTLGDNFNTSSVTDMHAMFGSCSALTTLTLGNNFDTSSVTSVRDMFYECSALTTLTLGDNFNTSSVTDMHAMFGSCSKLASLTLGNNFDTSSVEDMSNMFAGCLALESLTLYQASSSIVKELPSDTWTITDNTSITVGEVVVAIVSEIPTATWGEGVPTTWTNTPWTLSRTLT